MAPEFTIPEFPRLQFGTIFCIGRNYIKHAEEMGNTAPPEPVVFLKPRSSLVYKDEKVLLPAHSDNVQHEVELVVLIGAQVRKISPVKAMDTVKAVAVGLDLTARDIQSDAKQKGLPWAVAKGFDTFAPLGSLKEYTPQVDLQDLNIEMKINDEIRQSGNTSDMIFPVNEIISFLSHRFTLFPGDLIFTGTPEGVGPVQAGDTITATLGSGLSTLTVHAEN